MLDGLRICEFVEKPLRGDEPSNFISSGTWLLEPEVLDRIPDADARGRDGFSGRTLFAGIIDEGLLLRGFVEGGAAIDLASPEQYLLATAEMLASFDKRLLDQQNVPRSAHFIGDCLVGADAQIDASACIIGPAVIGDACVIGAGAVVERSVLWKGVHVGAGAHVTSSIVGDGATIGVRASVMDAVLGSEAYIADASQLEVGARVPPGQFAPREPRILPSSQVELF